MINFSSFYNNLPSSSLSLPLEMIDELVSESVIFFYASSSAMFVTIER